MSRNVLFILTSHGHLLNGEATGLWLEEFAVPYLALKSAGHRVTVSSVAGGAVPVDPRSAPDAAQRRAWAEPLEHLADTPAFDALRADEYQAVFLPGGHGTVFDMPYNRRLHGLLDRFESSGRIIAALCHAPAVFAGMRRADGTPFIAGRVVAAFTDAEERAVHGEGKVPFLLETRLRELGAVHRAAAEWTSNAVRDGQLITGQNPQSSLDVAALVMDALGAR